MGFFTKRERVFDVKGDKAQWKAVKALLKEAGIDISSGSYSSEPPVGGCGAKLDIRDFGPRGKIDRDIYYIDAAVDQLAAAKEIVEKFKAVQ